MSEAIYTPEGLISYPFVFEPRATKQIDPKTGKPILKYTATFIFLAGTDLKPLKTAYIAAVHAKFGIDKGNEMIQQQILKSPFRTDWAKKKYPEGSTFINTTALKKPGIVSIYRDPDTGKAAKITDPEQIYAGARVIASLKLFWFDVDGNRGFSFGVNNIQKRGDGPRLDGRLAPEDEFNADEDAPAGGAGQMADLSDLV